MSAEETNVQTDIQSEPPDRDWDAEARSMGWKPKEEFKGDPAKWIEAKAYVTNGEKFIPILNHTNKELKGRLGNVEGELAQTRRLLEMANKALEEVKEVSREGSLEGAEAKKKSLYAAIAQARKDDDVEGELQLREQLDDLNEEIRDLRKKPAAAPANGGPPPGQEPWRNDPIHQQFMSDNQWFGVDQEKTQVALAYMNYLNTQPETVAMGKQAKYDAVAKRIGELYPAAGNARRGAPARVEGSRSSGGGGRNQGGDRGFEDLPSDAQAQCDRQSSRFVGRADAQGNVKFKTQADYRAHFARQFFDESWGSKQMTGASRG